MKSYADIIKNYLRITTKLIQKNDTQRSRIETQTE